jgi:hypothetical protein
MNETTASAGLLHRLLPLFLAGAAALLVICAWAGPLSGWYLLRAVVVGLIQSSLTISFRGWDSSRFDRLLQALLVTALVAGGFFWSKDQTFGHTHAGPFWPLAGQFLAAVLVVFFAALRLAGPKPGEGPAGAAR